MSDLTELLRFLHGAGSSIIPWLVIALMVYFVIYLKPYIIEHLKAQSNAKKALAQKEGERNEIIRNCSATIEACTAVLEMVKADKRAVIDKVNEHEAMSAERMEHIQTVVDQCRDEILKTRGDIHAINARLEK